MFEKLLKLFGAGRSDAPASAKEKSLDGANVTLKDLENFVSYVVRVLVDAPDEVKISTEDADNGGKVIRISCRKEDIGKIIGKKGKTIIALRTLVGGAANRLQEHVSVEVVD